MTTSLTSDLGSLALRIALSLPDSSGLAKDMTGGSMLNQIFAAMNLMVDEAAEVASVTNAGIQYGKTPRERAEKAEKAVGQIKRRIFRHRDGTIQLAWVTFHYDPDSVSDHFFMNGQGHPQQFPTGKIYGTAQIADPKTGTVQTYTVVPHTLFNGRGGHFPFVVQEGVDWESRDWGLQRWNAPWQSVTVLCFFLEPLVDRKSRESRTEIRAVPLNWASEGTIALYNRLFSEMVAEGQKPESLEPINRWVHGWNSPTPYLLFAPIGNPGIPFWGRAEHMKDRGENGVPKRSPFYDDVLIYAGGYQVQLAEGYAERPTLHQDGYHWCRWQIMPGETRVCVRYICEEGQEIVGQTVQIAIAMDPFVVLSLDPATVSPGRQVYRQAESLLEAVKRGEQNSLLQQAYELGFFTASQSREAQLAGVEACAQRAVELANRQILELVERFTDALTGLNMPGRPALSELVEVMDEENLYKALDRNTGDCKLATWIASMITNDGTFHWGMPVMRFVRQRVLVAMAKQGKIKLELDPRKRPSKSKIPQVQIGGAPTDSKPTGKGPRRQAGPRGKPKDESSSESEPTSNG
ncbi:hypothetical protein CO174_01405, partial [Candidatus Uhrbacteria bacterium CG_4_9_14_3_um_filter_50_9]